MASIITATTTSGLTQSADNSGVLQLASGVGNLVTVPAVTGTAMVSGNQPAFRGFTGHNTSASTATSTQITATFGVTFDTASAFNTGTGRFTPQVAGYYQVTAYVDFGFSGVNAAPSINAVIFKNGSAYNSGGCATVGGGTFPQVSVTDIVFLNGTTDYVTCGVFQNSGSTVSNVRGGFSACLVRAA